MFMYINGNDINKAIANHFEVKKLKLPKVKAVTIDDGVLKANQLGGYSESLNTIFINDCLWNISSNFEMHALLIHELIHVYQHTYGLCEFDYEANYDNRPQEVHCCEHCSVVLATFNIPFESFILNLIFEEAEAQ